MLEAIRKKLYPEDYREPVKADFINSQYRIVTVDWRDVVCDRGIPIYGKRPLWAIERYSPKYGWLKVTAQILPYCYEEISFFSVESAQNHLRKLQDPNSNCFDGMVDYTRQNPMRFELTFFPKD